MNLEEQDGSDNLPAKQFLGTHICADLYQCDPSTLSELSSIKQIFSDVTKLMGLKTYTHKFVTSLENVQGVYYLGKSVPSSVSIITFPEYSTASLDIIMPKVEYDTDNLIKLFCKGFGAGYHKKSYLFKGNFHSKLGSTIK
jgi:S-adenosylmethionine/arginine decarboxylase-like enzyme